MFSTIRLRLILLVLIVALPTIGATLLVIERFADAQTKAQEQTLISATRALAAAIDAELKKYVTLGHALGTSNYLQTGDFVQFAIQAKNATSQLSGSWVVVANNDGQQLVNTLRPYGVSLPSVVPLDLHYRALQTRMYQVGDILIGPVAKRPAVGIFVPIFKNDEPQFNIVIGLDPHVFTRILDDQQLPSGWVVGLGDRKGRFVARSIDNDRFLTEQISEGWRAASLQGSEGYFNNISKEGIPLHSAYKNLPDSAWTVSVGVSRAVLNQSLQDSLWFVGLSSLVLVSLSLGLAWMVARSIVQPLRSLESASLSLLQNEPVNLILTGLHEIDHAVGVFETAAKKIREREDRHTLLINELNHRVKNLFAIMGGIVSLSAKTAPTPQELAKAIRGRLDALARAHELILPNVLRSKSILRQTTSIDVLIRAILMPYIEMDRSGEERVFTSGSPITIGEKAATSLALAIHELATNAAKYGALSDNLGRLDVSWIIDGEKLCITWLERSDRLKLIQKPSQEGFGSILADRSVKAQLGGELLREWHPNGLKVTLILPLKNIDV